MGGRTTVHKIVAGILLAGAAGGVAQAQTSDSLLNKLVEKGVLTTKEADDLKKESTTETRKDWVKGAGMPEWVTGVKLYGDFRGRYEQNTAESSAYSDRNRFRYRLRLGLTTTMLDDFEVGIRFASGNPQFNQGGILVGGSPVTANQDLNSVESRKFLWIDAAYAKWSAIKTEKFTLAGTIGKMDNPFQLSNMVWDYDINPEGAALQAGYNINEQHALKGIAAIYVLDEFNQGNPSGGSTPAGTAPGTALTGVSKSHDPFVYGAQTLLESKWTPSFETSLGLAAFAIDSARSLSAQVEPFYNGGNSRTAAGYLKYNMDPIIGSGYATYKFDSFPLYPGKFPVKVGGEFMDNPSAPSNNQGWRAGLTLGKAGKKKTWEINYRYQRLEADAWYDALVDDDNGAFYAGGNPQLGGTLKGSGWFGGTNVKGHQVIATYSFTDFLNFTLIYYNNDLIINAPGAKSDAQHFMADLNWKF